jgi:NDP-sugar pyrophosphorylase family protein
MGGDVTEPLPPIVLQAGGKGERMRAGGVTEPKVLTKVQGVALLERLIRQLANEGARRVYVITGHAADAVEAHVRGIEGLPVDMALTFVREREPRGNVGALAQFAHLDTPVLFSFGDLFTTLSFRALFARHCERGSAITAASHFETHRLQLGQLIVDGDRVLDYREKPEHRFLICSGIMAIEPAVLRLLPKEGTVGMSGMVDLALRAGLAVSHWEHGASWIDVNTPELLAAANGAAMEA